MDISNEFTGKNTNLVRWMCVQYWHECGKCKGKLETNIRVLYVTVSKRGYRCIPKLARMEVKIKLGNSRKNYVKCVCACTYNL